MGADTKNVKTMNDEQVMRINVKDKNDAANERTPVSQSRQLITARQMNKLARGDNPVFLAIVRLTNEAPQERNQIKGLLPVRRALLQPTACLKDKGGQ